LGGGVRAEAAEGRPGRRNRAGHDRSRVPGRPPRPLPRPRQGAETGAAGQGGATPVPSFAAPPNVLAVGRRNGHAAAAWFLQEPVHKYPGARDRPQQLYRRTVEYYRHVLGGDPAYNGVTFRNAIVAGLHPEDWTVDHPATSGYNLTGELAEYIAPYWRVPRMPTTPEGRHATLFRLLMKRAGPEYVTDDDVRAPAHGWNEAQRAGQRPTSRTRVVR